MFKSVSFKAPIKSTSGSTRRVTTMAAKGTSFEIYGIHVVSRVQLCFPQGGKR